jgi:two-component system response regulator DctR
MGPRTISSTPHRRLSCMIDIVEDDLALAEGLMLLFESCDYQSRHFSSGESYLDDLEKQSNDPRGVVPGCVLLDIRLSNISGLMVFDRLQKLQQKFIKPVIFITGHGDMDTAIDVLTHGAFDFVSKPFVSESLLSKVERAVDKSTEELEYLIQREDVLDRVRSLTPKELAVMAKITTGVSNREISEESGNSIRTIELHRAHVMQKMGVSNAVELTTLLARHDLIDAHLVSPAK